MVLPVLVISWFAGLLGNMAPSTKTITASFYICMFVRFVYMHLMLDIRVACDLSMLTPWL